MRLDGVARLKVEDIKDPLDEVELDKAKFDMDEALRLYPPSRGGKQGQSKAGSGRAATIKGNKNTQRSVKSSAAPAAEGLADMAALLEDYVPSASDLEAKDPEAKNQRHSEARHNWCKERKNERIDDEIDLHHLYQAEAQLRLRDFFERAQRNGLRKIRIIHGKGLHAKEDAKSAGHSAGAQSKKGILQQLVTNFLQERKNSGTVLDFYHPPSRDGGKGATVVLLP